MNSGFGNVALELIDDLGEPVFDRDSKPQIEVGHRVWLVWSKRHVVICLQPHV